MRATGVVIRHGDTNHHRHDIVQESGSASYPQSKACPQPGVQARGLRRINTESDAKAKDDSKADSGAEAQCDSKADGDQGHPNRQPVAVSKENEPQG